MMNKRSNTETLTESGTSIGNGIRHAGHKISEMGENAGSKTDHLIHQSHELFDKLHKEAGEYGDVVVDYIKKNPVKSALIAGGIGLLLAKLLMKD